MTNIKSSKTGGIVVDYFPIPNKAQEIFNLVREYQDLRWDAYHGVKSALKRADEIEETFKELGLE